MLPEKPAIDGYEIVAHTVPADEVGGDYYDILSIEDKDWLVIGDVSGHGVPAGLIMMMVQTAIQTTLMKNPNLSPTELLLVVNKSISKNIRKLGEDKYMTITVFALLDNNKFYFSGLHQDLFIYRHASKDVEIRETDGTWIGLFEDIEGMNKDEHFIMESGDCLLLFTDGITESWHKGSTKENRKPEADMFGDKKLVELFKENGHKPCEEIKNSILSALEDYDSVDDITMVFLKKI